MKGERRYRRLVGWGDEVRHNWENGTEVGKGKRTKNDGGKEKTKKGERGAREVGG
jgi:hypothetical protein